MVYRIYVEKKPSEALDARALLSDIRGFLGIHNLCGLRIINRYDVEHISEALFSDCIYKVFAEPQLDTAFSQPDLPAGAAVFATEFLPGQFDQRADSAAQCIQIVSQSERPTVRTAKVYVLEGALSEAELSQIKAYLINPVESREASLALPETLDLQVSLPTEVEILTGFTQLRDEALPAFIAEHGLAMDDEDLMLCRAYFASEKRDPTITELRMLDTYWSDHCRHTTFNTVICDVEFEDIVLKTAWERYLAVRRELGRDKPVSLMDIATLAVRKLKADGHLDKLDESEEINACTVKVDVTTESGKEKWLLFFKNETHNHPTEIEPFGGAATCIGGAIRDPLSGRGYVYAAMRITGAADPLQPVSETPKGKLPQRKIVTTAAAGYSSYGNQIGLATGIVDELYHPGYAAKHMELGAVLAAAPEEYVCRERPTPGDLVVLLGGRTGRDGCGGATGSSKAHSVASIDTCGAEVQKGNAPEERKLQRLFRNPEATRLIKRCNDFGAGGVSVAIGELADGVDINLDAVPKKYEGLDGTELAISESQERMAVVIDKNYVNQFAALAAAENVEATVVAEVTDKNRLTMRWNGNTIVDIARDFLDSNGAKKRTAVAPAAAQSFAKDTPASFEAGMRSLVSDLNVCSKRSLSERFDSTIGTGTVLMPFGGRHQKTPIQAMVHKLPRLQGETSTCSFMAYGCNPAIGEKSPYHAAYLAVVESVSKLVASGASFENVYLSLQEYFEKPMKDSGRWGKPFAAILGAFMAQTDLKIAAIGGKDSMSGSFEDLDVPPTLVSFAVTTDEAEHAVSPEFKAAGHKVYLLSPEYDRFGVPEAESLRAVFTKVTALMRSGKVTAAYTPVFGGVAEGLFKMCLGNGLGFRLAPGLSLESLFAYRYGSFVLELTEEVGVGVLLGETTEEPVLVYEGATLSLDGLEALYEGKLEPVYPSRTAAEETTCLPFHFARAGSYPKPKTSAARPHALIPVFPGTNCEYDTACALERAGISAETLIIRNLNPNDMADSAARFAKALSQSQMVVIPGGFSGGDEPDGSAKFITAFFRNPAIRDGVEALLHQRDGLMLGICNGFQALIKLGLVPYGHILDAEPHFPTLSFNAIGRHQSKLVRTMISSNLSPWLMNTKAGEIYTIPISHGEGRFLADEALTRQLGERGQIATQYVDLEGRVSQDIQFNPNGSFCAVEGITSPDGRVLGKMGHAERVGKNLYQNTEGLFDMGLFSSAFAYFQ